MTGMKNITIMSHNQCINPPTTSCCQWDFKIQTGNKIEYSKADIMVLDKIKRKCLIINVAYPIGTLSLCSV